MQLMLLRRIASAVMCKWCIFQSTSIRPLQRKWRNLCAQRDWDCPYPELHVQSGIIRRSTASLGIGYGEEDPRRIVDSMLFCLSRCSGQRYLGNQPQIQSHYPLSLYHHQSLAQFNIRALSRNSIAGQIFYGIFAGVLGPILRSGIVEHGPVEPWGNPSLYTLSSFLLLEHINIFHSLLQNSNQSE